MLICICSKKKTAVHLLFKMTFEKYSKSFNEWQKKGEEIFFLSSLIRHVSFVWSNSNNELHGDLGL